MRKNFGAKPILYPQPVFIIATYNENDFTVREGSRIDNFSEFLRGELSTLNAEGDLHGILWDSREDLIRLRVKSPCDLGGVVLVIYLFFLNINILDSGVLRESFFIFRYGIEEVFFLQSADGDDG